MSKRSLWLLVAPLAAAMVLALALPAAAQEMAPEQPVTINADDVSFDENAPTSELLDSAREMFLADNYVLAEMLYKSVLVREPDHLDAMLELAIVYEAMGRLDYSRGLLTRAAMLKPDDSEIIRRNNETAKKLGDSLEDDIDALLDKGKYESVIPKLSVLLTTQPENADLYYKRAKCHFELGHPQNALDDLSRALDLRTDDRYFQLKTRAVALQKKQKIRTLTARAKKNILLDTTEARERALAAVSGVLELDPENPWAQQAYRDLVQAQVEKTTSMPKGKFATFWQNVRDLGNPASEVFAAVGAFVDSNLWILLAVLAILLVFNSPLTRFLMRGIKPSHLLGGQVERFSLAEILMLIHTHNGTGVLRVRGDTSGEVYFSDGEVTHCKTTRLSGEKALKGLLTSSQGSFVFSESDIPAERTVHTPLSLILLDVPSPSTNYSMQSEEPPRIVSSRIKTLLNSKQ